MFRFGELYTTLTAFATKRFVDVFLFPLVARSGDLDASVWIIVVDFLLLKALLRFETFAIAFLFWEIILFLNGELILYLFDIIFFIFGFWPRAEDWASFFEDLEDAGLN